MRSPGSLGIALAACLALSAAGPAQPSLARFTDAASVATTVTAAASFDVSAPTIQASVISKASEFVTGYVRQGGTYHVYANVTDSGTASSGVAAVTADVAAISGGQSSVALVSGMYTVGGVAYDYRSAALTADATLAAGMRSYGVIASDEAGNSSGPTDFSVMIDNTRPFGIDVQTANGAATAGRPEAGDSIMFTFSEPIDPASILAGWNGSSTSIVVRIADGGLLGMDLLMARNSANTATLPLGSVNLGGMGYVSATRDFGAGGTPSTMIASGSTITVVLGTASGSTGTEMLMSNMTWMPSASATDRAGNACLTTTVTETVDGILVDTEF